MSTTAKELREMGEKMMAMAASMEAPAQELPPKPSQEWLDYANRHECEVIEWREVARGDLYAPLAINGGPQVGTDPILAAGPLVSGPRWILRKRAATPAPVPPPGLLQNDWEHTGELREPRKLADGTYEPWLACHGEVITDCFPNKSPGPQGVRNLAGYTDARRWIVRPKAKAVAAQPVPTAADVPDGWEIDQGPMTWREACKLYRDKQRLTLTQSQGWFVFYNYTYDADKDNGVTYTLKRKTAPAPTVTPWKSYQVPVGALIKFTPNDVPDIITQSMVETVQWDRAARDGSTWCWPHEQFDGAWRPCGEVAK